MKIYYSLKTLSAILLLNSFMSFGQKLNTISDFSNDTQSTIALKKEGSPLFAQNPNGQSGGAVFVFSNGNGYYSADDFSLNTSTEVKNMEFIGYQVADTMLTLCKGAVLYIYEDANGLPSGIPGKTGAPIFSLELSENDPRFKIEKIDSFVYDFLIDTTGFTAQAGQKYWVVFAPKVNTTNANDYDSMWNWFFSSDNHLSEAQFVDPNDIFQAGITNWLSYYLAYGDILGPDAKALSFALYDYNYLATNDSSIGKNIKLYPNPATDEIHINSTNISLSEIYDMSGKLVVTSRESAINISKLDKGIYNVKITLKNGEKLMRKLLKK